MPILVTRDAPYRQPAAGVVLPNAPETVRFRSAALVSSVLVLGADDGSVHLWEPGKPMVRWGEVGRGPALVVASSVPGRIVTVADGALSIMYLAVPGTVRYSREEKEYSALCVVPNPSGEIAVLSGTSGGLDRVPLEVPLSNFGEVLVSNVAIHALCHVSAIDGSVLVVGRADGVLDVVDFASMRVVGTMRGHTSRIRHLVTIPSTQGHVVSVSHGSVRIWNVAARREERRFDLTEEVNAVTVLPGDPPRIVWGDKAGALTWLDGPHQPVRVDRRATGAVTALSPFPTADGIALAVVRRDQVTLIEVPTEPDPTALTGQRLIAYFFASLDGPTAQISALWRNCHSHVGSADGVRRVREAGRLLTDPRSVPEGTSTDLRESDTGFSAILRRDEDSLSLTITMASTVDGSSLSGPGWNYFERDWAKITEGGIDELLGSARIYVARSREVRDSAIESALPLGADVSLRRLDLRGCSAWDATARGNETHRRVVVVGDDDAIESALSLLDEYLMYAVELGFSARTFRPRPVSGDLEALRISVQETRRRAQYLWDRMALALGSLLPGDQAVATAFINELYDVDTEIDRALAARPRTEDRIGFAVDITGYGSRPGSWQRAARRQLQDLLEQVVEDLGLTMDQVHLQSRGDGTFVVLPPELSPAAALPVLLRGWRNLLAHRPITAADGLRLRLAVGMGAMSPASDGFGFVGAEIVQINRLLDSNALRRAAKDDPIAALIAVITDQLYQSVEDTIDLGFEQIQAETKTGRVTAWLWTGGDPGPLPPGSREIVLLHNGDEPVRRAMTDLLRALGLHPAEVSDLSPPTGTALEKLNTVLRDSAASGRTVLAVLPRGGANANLNLELGLALALAPRTLVIDLADQPTATDSMPVIRFNTDLTDSVRRLVGRLLSLGCPVDPSGVELLDPATLAALRPRP
ncbi:CATRA conflict system CASPASE/TPR repeat-associated protein [Actinoplanes sp. G11-F43]|uniref:CATRA conflict system CASPASE/TPR repeat-associated protein n=1 Tax=Actinoplanes sp. G11-F43 TaxID=3424130 RepID=UPI003D327DDF